MLGIGFQEMLVIAILALVLIGPKKLPEVAKVIGRALAEFKRVVNEVRDTVDEEIFKDEKKLLKDVKDEYEEIKGSMDIDLEEKSGNRQKKE